MHYEKHHITLLFYVIALKNIFAITTKNASFAPKFPYFVANSPTFLYEYGPNGHPIQPTSLNFLYSPPLRHHKK